MNYYNKDIAHCSGYLCPINENCLRYHLFLEWEKRRESGTAELARFTGAVYDAQTDDCPCFYPIPEGVITNQKKSK